MSDLWSSGQNNFYSEKKSNSNSSKAAFYVLIFLSIFSLLFILLGLFFNLKIYETPIDTKPSLIQSESATTEDSMEYSDSTETSEQKFLNLISVQQDKFGFNEEQALELGYLVCNLFQDGQTTQEIKSIIRETLANDIDAINGANENARIAVTTLCPEYSSYEKDFELNPIAENSDTSNSLCDSNYSGACVPIVPYDLDCPDIGQLVIVVGTDIHKFDRDRDGRACES